GVSAASGASASADCGEGYADVLESTRPATRLEARMPLDPQARDALDKLAAAGLGYAHTYGVEGARAVLGLRRVVCPTEPPPIHRREDRTVAGHVSIRIYWPEGDGPFPLLMYFHGGGWVLGSRDTHEGICRNLT